MPQGTRIDAFGIILRRDFELSISNLPHTWTMLEDHGVDRRQWPAHWRTRLGRWHAPLLDRCRVERSRERWDEGSLHAAEPRKTGTAAAAHGWDALIMYSPRTAYPDGEPLQAFTAIGTVVTGDVYQVQLTPDFQPHRVDVQFVPSRAAHIKPLVEHLSFITSKSRWGAAFRFGLVKISARDFALIAERMGAVSPCGARKLNERIPSSRIWHFAS